MFRHLLDVSNCLRRRLDILFRDSRIFRERYLEFYPSDVPKIFGMTSARLLDFCVVRAREILLSKIVIDNLVYREKR